MHTATEHGNDFSAFALQSSHDYTQTLDPCLLAGPWDVALLYIFSGYALL